MKRSPNDLVLVEYRFDHKPEAGPDATLHAWIIKRNLERLGSFLYYKRPGIEGGWGIECGPDKKPIKSGRCRTDTEFVKAVAQYVARAGDRIHVKNWHSNAREARVAQQLVGCISHIRKGKAGFPIVSLPLAIIPTQGRTNGADRSQSLDHFDP